MPQSLISVIVPIYNVEDYIEECLKSIAQQNYSNYEVILINDGSTDDSMKVVSLFIESNSEKFRLYHKENGGLSDARNFGLNKAKGEFVVFIDSDDYIAPTMLSTVGNAAQESKSDIVCFALAEVSEQGNKIRYIPANSTLSIGTYALSDAKNLISSSLPNACNKLIRKSLFTQNNIQFPVGLWYEDLAINPKLFFFANSITFIEDELYFYRQRDGAITKTFSLKVMDIYQVLASLVTFFKVTPYENAKTDLNTWYINLTIITLARLSLNNEQLEKKRALAEIAQQIKQHFPAPLDIFSQAFSKKRYKIFAILIRFGFTRTVAKTIKLLVQTKAITI